MEINVPGDFSQTTRKITSHLQSILRNVTAIQRMVNLLGTRQDTDRMRAELHELQHETHDLVRDVNANLKELASLPASENVLENKQRRLQRERLASQFADVLQQFQLLQKSAAEKEKDSAVRARASFISSHESEGMGNDGQKQVQLDLDELQELREREEAVRRIESDIVDVNQIFNELAILVQDQGETIDTIDANIGTALNQVEEGTNQLEKAVVYQQKARKKVIILIALLLILVIAVILIIYFTTKK